ARSCGTPPAARSRLPPPVPAGGPRRWPVPLQAAVRRPPSAPLPSHPGAIRPRRRPHWPGSLPVLLCLPGGGVRISLGAVRTSLGTVGTSLGAVGTSLGAVGTSLDTVPIRLGRALSAAGGRRVFVEVVRGDRFSAHLADSVHAQESTCHR